MPHVENDRIVESTNEARVGVTGHNVRYVLLISALAVIVLFVAALGRHRPPALSFNTSTDILRGCMRTLTL
jgi:hypothetical protein